MKTKNLVIGRLGEIIAREYLYNKGYKIIAQNYRNRYAEIDLIARDKKVLVFVEVRTKTSELFGIPEETLNRKKLERLVRNTEAYVAYQGYKGLYRIDAICIVFDQDSKIERLNHYKDVTF